MTVLAVGATGATGKRLIEQLLDHGESVRAIVRDRDRLPEEVKRHAKLTIVQASLLDLSDEEMAQYVTDCDAVASCLGHNLSLRGIYAPPRRLVTEATRRLCSAIRATHPQRPVKFVLMNTVGNRNRDLNEQVSRAEKVVVGLLRLVLPPQADNEQAAEYLRTQVGQNDGAIEWVVVRPDSLTDDTGVSAYELHPSPQRSAIFNPGRTSRINVAHFMAQLITNDSLWNQWKGQMPAIYNKESAGAS